MSGESVHNAILATLMSVNVADNNLEPANVVDVMQRIADGASGVAEAIASPDALMCDENGNRITSLTESVLVLSKCFIRIAESIEHLADAVREREAKSR